MHKFLKPRLFWIVGYCLVLTVVFCLKAMGLIGEGTCTTTDVWVFITLLMITGMLITLLSLWKNKNFLITLIHLGTLTLLLVAETILVW